MHKSIKVTSFFDQMFVIYCRWFKYEEDLDPDNGSWGKPHISQLSFQALSKLRLCFEKSTLLLDLAANSFPVVVQKLIENTKISEKDKAVFRTKLLLRDKGLQKKSWKFGDVVDNLIHETSKAEKAKEENEKLLKLTGKDAELSTNGKGAGDQVEVIGKIIRIFSCITYL